MKTLHKLAFLPALLLATTSAGITPENSARLVGKAASVDYSTAPRVDVDKPVELIPLYLRDKRIHGLKPLQSLVDA
ncbi:MAG: nitrous oxide reductase family maturation protein NosD, partial [Betaproteobacteria bacterium]